jgi:hypothetical protein
MPDAIQEIPCSTAEKLLEKLSNKNPLWKNKRRFWVFRGHGDDANYKLIPTALRPDAKLGFTHKPKDGVQSSNAKQIRAEFNRLHEFYWAADAQGLHIPIDGNLLRTPEAFTKLRKKIKKQWPCDNLLPLLALAQHYGISTRLLDWSDNPLAAAHFAAVDYIDSKIISHSKMIAVWALNFNWILHDAFPSEPQKKMGVYVVTAPRASNPNLHAQGGVFTTEILNDKDQKRRGKPVIRTVDEIVKLKWKQLKWHEPIMAHITLPCTEAKKLLRLLYKEGMDKSTLFPGYQGVADALDERSNWDKKERALYWIR